MCSHKALLTMFDCDGISYHASWNEVSHYWDALGHQSLMGFIWIISRSLKIEGAINIREVSSNIASVKFPAGSRFSQCSGFRNKTWYTPKTDPFTLEIWIWWRFLIAHTPTPVGSRDEALIEGSNNITLWSSGRRSSNWASSEIDMLNWIVYYTNSLNYHVLIR